MIIAAITGPAPEDARRQLRLSSRYAQMVEFRLDLIAGGAVKDLARGCRKPWIATCRPVREGGKHAGDERGRLGRLLDAATAGAAFVDIELDAIRDFRALLGSQHVRTRLIVSRHAFDRPLPDVARTYRALRAVRADVVKLSFMADDAWQLSLVREFLQLARRDRQRAIATAMGAAGEASRKRTKSKTTAINKLSVRRIWPTCSPISFIPIRPSSTTNAFATKPNSCSGSRFWASIPS